MDMGLIYNKEIVKISLLVIIVFGTINFIANRSPNSNSTACEPGYSRKDEYPASLIREDYKNSPNNTCIPNICSCQNGVAALSSCPKPGVSRCDRCNIDNTKGYYSLGHSCHLYDDQLNAILEDRGFLLPSTEIAITMLWNDRCDLDIHIFEPSGIEIWYQNKQTPNTGNHDIDDLGDTWNHPFIENVSWKKAPWGTYRVEVSNYGCWANVDYKLYVTT